MITFEEYVETTTKLGTETIKRNENEIKRLWSLVKAESECSNPDVNELRFLANRIEEKQRGIAEARMKIQELNSIKRIFDGKE